MAEVVFDNVPEEVLHAVVAFWHFKEGDHIEESEEVVDLKTDKGKSFTLTAPVSGILIDRFYSEEDEVEIGDVLAEIEEDSEGFDEELNIMDFNDSEDKDEDDGEIIEEEEVEEVEEEETDEYKEEEEF